MNINDLVCEYFENGFTVIPLEKNSKRCTLFDWQKPETFLPGNKNDYKKLIKNGNYRYGFGLLVGKYSNIIVADIDTLDLELQEKIVEALPASRLIRRGNPHKKPSLFYKYSNVLPTTKIYKDNNSKTLLELLSTGRQVVLPPTPHPDFEGKYFEWLGESLPSFDPEELNEITQDHLNQLQEIFNSYNPTIKSILVGGRNNSLKSMCWAALEKGKSIYEVANELYEYDIANHNPPLFSDKKDKYRSYNDPEVAALSFAKSNKKSFDQYKETRAEVISFKPVKKEQSFTKNKYPKFEGIGQLLFENIYNTSPKPMTAATLPTVLAFMSLLIGNRFEFKGIRANLYCMMMAPSGSGKDHPMKFLSKLLDESDRTEYLGESSYSSDTSIIMNLTDQKNQRIDILDEASRLFASLGKSSQNYERNIANTLQQLYTDAGGLHLGKSAYKYKSKKNPEGRIGRVKEPYLVLLAAMTIKDFREHFKTSLIDKGLGGRFLYFADSQRKEIQHDRLGNLEIHSDLIALTKKWLYKPEDNFVLVSKCRDAMLSNSDYDIIKKELKRIEKYMTKKIKDNDQLEAIYLRQVGLIKKMSLIKALDRHSLNDIENFSIQLIDFAWSLEWCEKYLSNIEVFFDLHLRDTEYQKIQDLFVHYIRLRTQEKKVAARSYLSNCRKIRSLGLEKKKRIAILDDLVDQKIIKQVFDSASKEISYILG